MKFVLICAIVALAALCVNAESHNVEWGKVGPNDRMIYREIHYKKSKWLQIVTEDVEFVSPSRITAIKVLDQYTNGDGGYATLYKGGVGYSDVTIHLKSQRGHGFNFIVEIYGQ